MRRYAFVLSMVSCSGVASAQSAALSLSHDDPDGMVSPGEVVAVTMRISWSEQPPTLVLGLLQGDITASPGVGVASSPAFAHANPWANQLTVLNPGTAVGGGVVHVLHRNASSNDLMYSRRTAPGSWTTQTVDATGSVGEWSSVVIDASGALHASYYDATNRDVRYARRAPAGGWTFATPDGADDVGQYTSIAIDAAGGVHISYQADRDPIMLLTLQDLRHAYLPSGGSWTTETVEANGDVGRYTAMTVDLAGRWHIVHHDGNNDLRHVYRQP